MDYKVLGRDNGKELRRYDDGREVRVPFEAPGVAPVPDEAEKAVNALKAKLKKAADTEKALNESIKTQAEEITRLTAMVETQKAEIEKLTNEAAAKPADKHK